MILRTEIFPAVSVNKGFSQSSAIVATMECELVSPEETQKERLSRYLVAITLQPFPIGSPGETQDTKIQDTGPR